VSLFDRLVDEALQGLEELTPLRAVVEKELLHHDILREMSSAGLLAGLTFMGGTCLRACYGANRLSEDLNFTGGTEFDRASLSALGKCLEQGLETKYGLAVSVSEPVRETGNVDTWKVRIVTRPKRRELPSQRIHLDICSLPSYTSRPRVMVKRYGIAMGTSGLILQAQSREEILADKVVAVALRPNRVKYRDLWDIAWLRQQDVRLPVALVPRKLADRHCAPDEFLAEFSERIDLLVSEETQQEAFLSEMRRFLPPDVIVTTAARPEFWEYLGDLLHETHNTVCEALTSEGVPHRFPM